MKRRFVFMILLFALVLYGCRRNTHNQGNKSISGTSQYTQKELRESLKKYEVFFIYTITNTCKELNRLSNSKPNRRTLQLRSETVKACEAMLDQEDPLMAFIDVWVLSVRLSDYFKSGHGSDAFEPKQQVIIRAMNKIESNIEYIGLEYLDKKHYEKIRQKVRKFAKANPIKPGLKETILFATEYYEGQRQFEELANLPLLPLTMVDGVRDEMSGMKEITNSTDHIAEVVEEFPESARWQLMMLLYDIEKMESVKTTVKSISEFSDSASRISETADKLPEQLRAEISLLLKDIEEKSGNILKMLNSADSVSFNIKETLDKGDDLTRSVNVTSENIKITADAWREASISTEDAVQRLIEFYRMDEEDIDIEAYRDFAVELNKFADKVLVLFPRIDQLGFKSVWRVSFLIILFFGVLLAFVYGLVHICAEGKKGTQTK